MKEKRLIFLVFLFTFFVSVGQELEPVMDLDGKWRFSIGDNLEWAGFLFDDTDWNQIYVPDSWEEQGYHGYDGIAWYRYKFKAPTGLQNQNLYLELGYIDDVDEVFLNGVKIGSTGSFPPFFKTAYNAYRVYPIPNDLLNLNAENSIAVRVYDKHLEGGIIRGKIRLLKEKNPLLLDLNLQGYWKFKIGDNKDWRNLSDYSSWKDIFVPEIWENQGYRDYDGYAWYVIQFTPQESLINEKLVLVLGKIDDIDEVYINGKLIAATGIFSENRNDIRVSSEYSEFRGYYLPDNVLKSNTSNTIAVRVFDARVQGGIYEGPIGIVTQEKYIQYWRSRKESQ